MRGWKPWLNPYGIPELPREQQDIWIMREGWEKPILTWRRKMYPEMNAIGLYWVPAIDGEGPPEWPNK